MKKLVFIAWVACVFVACSEKEQAGLDTKFDVISFEAKDGMLDLATEKPFALGDVTLNLFEGGNHTFRNVYCAKVNTPEGGTFDGLLFSTKDGGVSFGSYFDGKYDVWGGFALTRSYDKTATAVDYRDQFSAWTSQGANGTKTCMVGYDSSWSDNSYALPTVIFDVSRIVDHLYLANATVTHAYTPSKDVPEGGTYFYKVMITGWLGGQVVGTVECELVNGATAAEDWRKVSLLALGEVDKLEFKPASNDRTTNGYMNDPAYFCVDEIALVKEK